MRPYLHTPPPAAAVPNFLLPYSVFFLILPADENSIDTYSGFTSVPLLDGLHSLAETVPTQRPYAAAPNYQRRTTDARTTYVGN